MVGAVDVLISVEAVAAATLNDARTREAIGHIISRFLRPHPGDDPMLANMQHISAEAAARPDAGDA